MLMKLSLFFFTSILLFFIEWDVFSQELPLGYYIENLRYIENKPSATARFIGFGGGGTALGGDVSNIWHNPAGIGFFNNSILVLDLGFISNANSEHTDSKLYINSLALVSEKKDGVTLAISYNRSSNFHSTLNYNLQNDNNSIVDFFLEQANGIPLANLNNQLDNGLTDLNGLAYSTYIINPDFDDQYFSFIGLASVQQSEEIKRRGRMNQWNIAWSRELKSKLYYGFGFSYKTSFFGEDRLFQEQVLDDSNALKNITLNENLEQRIQGGHLQAGLIYRLKDYIRLGFNINSPSIIFVEEIYSADLTANYNNFEFPLSDTTFTLLSRESDETDILISDYWLALPLELKAGLAFFFKKYGFFTGEIEYIPHRSNRILDIGIPNTTTSADNNFIKNTFKNTFNIKLGLEFRFQNYYLRGGWSSYENPSKDLYTNKFFTNYSLGLGYRRKSFFIDFALLFSNAQESISPYFLAEASTPEININNQIVQAFLTFGIKI